jgi:hypothetical protein
MENRHAPFFPFPWFTIEPMKRGVRLRLLVFVLGSSGAILLAKPLLADAVPVRQTEGLLHGFLVLCALNGDSLATGDLTQVTNGDRVTSNLSVPIQGRLHL